jgi:hypothetical protein
MREKLGYVCDVCFGVFTVSKPLRGVINLDSILGCYLRLHVCVWLTVILISKHI